MGAVDTKLTILHIAQIQDEPFNGVANIVPQYLKSQSQYASVALLNLDDFIPPSSSRLYPVYCAKDLEKGLDSLPEPFNNPDIIIFHEVYKFAYLKMAHMARSKDISYIITPHGSLTSDAQHNKFLKKIFGNIMLFNKFIYHSKAIQFLSESEKIRSEQFSNLPSYVRSNGIELKGKLKNNFSKNRLHLVYIGRLDIKIKGIDRLLEAADYIQNEMRIKNISISIYGHGELNDITKIKKYIKEHYLEDLVKISGPLFGNKKIKAILQHDCFIQLSRTEGQPLGVMEALGIGMPCILTNGTTFLNIAHRNKICIPAPDEPTAIAQTILDVSEGIYNLKDISCSASKYVKVNFDWNVVSKLMVQDYKRVLKWKQ